MSSKAIVNRKLQYASASGIELFLLCARKWLAVYGYGHREPEVPDGPTALGSWGHIRMEDAVLEGIEPGYAADGTQLPPYEDARKNVLIGSCSLALNYLVNEFNITPGKPHEGIEIEKSIEATTQLHVAGTKIHGRIDFADFSDPLRPRILDYKTCSGFGNALSEEKLRVKTQVVLYVAYALERCPEADSVDIEYLYLNAAKLGTPQIRPVKTTFTREEAQAALKALEPTLDAMQRLARAETLEEAPAEGNDKPIREACRAFNKPCHIRTLGLCPAVLLSVTASATSEEVDDVTARLKARKRQQAG